MFDSYTVAQGPSYTNVSITEKKAPTDESVRLLKEMEKAAADKIINAVRVSSSKFECVIHTVKDVFSAQTRYVAVFELNEERMIAEYVAKPWGSTPESIAIGLRDAVAKEIANSIASAFDSLSF